MIGRLYQVTEQCASGNYQGSICRVQGASAEHLMIERAAISQTSQATSEQAEAAIVEYATASTGGDPVSAEHPLDPSDVAASFNALYEGGIINISEGITATYRYRGGWNLLSGFLWTPANDDEVIMSNGAGTSANFDLAIPTTNTALAWDFALTIREIGT